MPSKPLYGAMIPDLTDQAPGVKLPEGNLLWRVSYG